MTRNPQDFKIHPSQCWKIMSNAKVKGDLSVTCMTFLKEWYSGDEEEISSKYLWKGNVVELDNIDFAARVLGYGLAEKNTVTYSNDWMIGTPDVIWHDTICDVKAPWDRKLLLDNIKCDEIDAKRFNLSGKIDPEYEWQLRCYMALLNKPTAILFYGLQNTPPTEYRDEVIYDDLPDHDRWIAYRVSRDEAIEKSIIDRVIKCREWLRDYDKLVGSKVGRVL